MSFKNAVLQTPVETTTKNGMKAYTSTMSKCLDFYYAIGGGRGTDIIPRFEAAYQEDRELALKIAQWARDIRGGAGERQLYRDILLYLEGSHREELLNTRILQNTAEIGRYDDLLIFNTNEVNQIALGLYARALSERNQLAAKWAPRKDERAVKLTKFLGITPRKYRKLIVSLTNVVENKMCARQWSEINFSHVPSLAMSRYSTAFRRRAPAEFESYKKALKSGDPSVSINSDAVYPYDVIKNSIRGNAEIADAQWAALPNFMGNSKVLPLVDVSASMEEPAGGCRNITCMDVAVSLGLYCAEKNTGAFKDLFLTFTSNPEFVHLEGTLSEKLIQMMSSEWGYSTNLESAFTEILRVATLNSVPAEDMPEYIIIFSDMQFDVACDLSDSAIEMVERNYDSAGYTRPKIIFWNIKNYGNVPVSKDKHDTALVSGFSPAIMKSILSADLESFNPMDVMLESLQDPRYDLIRS